jgi:hypothetical protein
MSERQKLLQDIECFIDKFGLAASRFGLLAMNDPALVKRLRAGGDVRTETAQKLRDFMRGWKPPVNPKRRAEARAA